MVYSTWPVCVTGSSSRLVVETSPELSALSVLKATTEGAVPRTGSSSEPKLFEILLRLDLPPANLIAAILWVL